MFARAFGSCLAGGAVVFAVIFCGANVAQAQTANAEATLVKILAADETPFDPNTFEPDGDGIVDRAHLRLLDRVINDADAPRHAEVYAIWTANRAQVDSDNQLSAFLCRLLQANLGLTCDDFEIYGASQITIGDPAGNARIQRLLDTVGIDVSVDDYDTSAAVWLAAAGDLDDDGFSNVEEYNAVCADFDAFVSAAIDPVVTPNTLFCCGSCPLSFDTLPGDADKYAGESHMLDVSVVNAESQPHYAWLRDGQPVGADSPTLKLDSITLADAGSYVCQVSDSGETITSPTVTLRVVEHMSIIEQPVPVRVYVGERVEFSLTASGGFLPLDYAWMRGITPVGSNAPSFILNSAALADAGNYRCEVGDLYETVMSDAATLEVARKVSIVTQPRSQTVLLGRSVALVVEAQFGLGALSYQWLHDGTPIGDNTQQLTLDSVTRNNVGQYWCVVSDDRESTESTRAGLTVVDSLSITMQPAGVRKLMGQDHTLAVAVIGGLPPVRFEWHKDGLALVNESAATLTLQNLDLDDAGVYTCVIADAESSVVSNEALLSVFEPLRFTAQPQGDSKLTGTSHGFEVQIEGGGGNESYRWFKDGTILMESDPRLELENLIPADSGVYHCEVTDEFGTLRSDDAVLTVADNIILNEQPQGAAKYTGNSHVLSVSAMGGLGPITYRWFKDNEFTGAIGHSIVLDPLVPSDSGVFHCEVTDGNEVVVSTHARLEVADHLQVIAHPVDARLLTGEPMELRLVTLGGLGGLHYQWFRNGAPLGVDSAVVAKSEVSLDDAGQYRCIISDQFEEVQSQSAEVVVAQALQLRSASPDTVLPLGDSYTLEVEVAGGLGPLSFHWFRDSIALSADGPRLLLAEVRHEDAGAYHCEIQDERGSIESPLITVTVITPIEWTRPLTELTALSGENATLTVAATGGDAPLHYEWFANGIVAAVAGPEFTFNPLRPQDAGLYVCRVTDGFQQRVSEAVHVRVLPRLAIGMQPSGGRVIEGEPFQFEISATGGMGGNRYVWRREGEPLPADGPILRINGALLSDSGSYTCEISDDFDRLMSKPAVLVVNPAPRGQLVTTPATGSPISFGLIDIGDTALAQLTMSNAGSAPLTVNASLVGDTDIQITSPQDTFTLEPGQSTTLQLSFTPLGQGPRNAELVLSVEGQQQARFRLQGEARSPKPFLSCGGAQGTDDPPVSDLLVTGFILLTLAGARLSRLGRSN